MKSKYNEVAIGLSVTLATLVVIVAILWLGKSNFLVKGLHIHLIVSDAQGLSVGDEVHFRGLSIGTVQSAEFQDGKILIKLKLEHDSHIPKDSRFSIVDAGLLGGKIVRIESGVSDSYLKTGAVVAGEPAKGFMSMLKETDSMKKKIDSVLINIDRLTGETTAERVTSTLNDLDLFLKDFKSLLQRNRKQITELIDNLNAISKENKKPVQEILATLSNQSETISASMRTIHSSAMKLDSLLAGMQSGEGTIGKLLTDHGLYDNMNQSFAQLDSLLFDMRKNPRKYFEVKVF